MAEREREDPPPGDPNAPLPDDVPPFIKAFYDTVNKLVDEIHDSDPVAGVMVAEVWGWMKTHVPERLLRPGV